MDLVIEAYTTKYADFTGRARRKEYWLTILLPSLIAFTIGFLLAITPKIGMFLYSPITIILFLGFALVTCIPNLAVTVRRLHDINRSGWWMLITAVPFIGGITFLVFMLLPGTQGMNDYGDDPKAPPHRFTRPVPTPIRRPLEEADLKPAPPRKPIEVDYD